jgi:hypothetical protein
MTDIELLKLEIATLTEQLYNAYGKIKQLQEEVESYGDSKRKNAGNADQAN